MSKITDKRRYINTKFWTDTWVMDELNPLDRYLFLYLLTNSRTNIAGVYEISLRQISFETGIEKDNLVKMMERIANKVIYFDGFIILKNALKHQNTDNSSINSGINNIIENIPENIKSKVLAYRGGTSGVRVGYERAHSDLDSDLDLELNSAEPTVIKENKEMGKAVQSIIAKRKKLKWALSYGGAKKEPEYAQHLLGLDSYENIIKVMDEYEKKRGEKYLPTVSHLEDLYRKYPDVKAKVMPAIPERQWASDRIAREQGKLK